MPSTRDIRNRIRGVKSTAKITRAMQLVASSKMKKAQDRALQGRPYAQLMARMIASLAGKIDFDEIQHPFLERREVRTRGLLVISTDRGLCGPLNANLFRELASTAPKDKTAHVTIGRKAKQFISRTGRKLLADFQIDEDAGFRDLRPVLEYLLDAYRDGTIDTLEILYPRFRNTLIQEPTLVPLLPIVGLQEWVADHAGDFSESSEDTETEDAREITFEPDPAEILENLIDLVIKRSVYQLFLDARASEHSARMVAMKAATDNAKKLVDDLTLQYNKARQAAITQEILEITAATQFN